MSVELNSWEIGGLSFGSGAGPHPSAANTTQTPDAAGHIARRAPGDRVALPPMSAALQSL
jgi:hypothetical protein